MLCAFELWIRSVRGRSQILSHGTGSFVFSTRDSPLTHTCKHTPALLQHRHSRTYARILARRKDFLCFSPAFLIHFWAHILLNFATSLIAPRSIVILGGRKWGRGVGAHWGVRSFHYLAGVAFAFSRWSCGNDLRIGHRKPTPILLAFRPGRHCV